MDRNTNKFGISLVILALVGAAVLIGINIQKSKPGLVKREKPTPFAIRSEIQDLAVNQKDYTVCISKAQEYISQDENSVEAWQWKGICEFQLRKFAEAKGSFERVLALDSENESAKNYMKLLNENANIVSSRDVLSKGAFESKLPIKLNNDFTLFMAYPLNLGNNVSEAFKGNYRFNITSAKALTYLKSQLDTKGIKYDLSDSETVSRIYFVYDNKDILEFVIGKPSKTLSITYAKK